MSKLMSAVNVGPYSFSHRVVLAPRFITPVANPMPTFNHRMFNLSVRLQSLTAAWLIPLPCVYPPD
ncbi:hypothetical protein [Pseudomonas sp. MH10]|uniref:hypothetical protein n=1 Tax=Pseudomonas sp. MH10 TaxID=3048627 RepID=UPI002AC8CF61|nr:hypothetical protein [Pseudomonas sp. MH10]MEB0039836.1 hypothetical protein [Pseudomonas sp. MH10]WPX64575.1 hypothetical protein RHM59_02445 [Pseudomonas sp. MH10]